MRLPALMVCKGLMNRCSPDVGHSLAQLLPAEDQAVLQQLPTPMPFEKQHLKWDLLDHAHFSWLAPFLRNLSESEVRLFLSVLSKDQIKGLQKILGFENHFPSLPNVAKSAMRQTLAKHLTQNKTLVPLAFLPESPLNFLLQASTDRLEKLVRYLGLHDLSYELRQIISTKKLKTIFATLSEKEDEYLNALMLHREPLIFKRLFLEKWDGSKEAMHKLLEERGAHRLGHVLFAASESFIWYLTHRLDMHLGTLILKFIEKPTHERAERLLVQQIEKIYHFLRPGESA